MAYQIRFDKLKIITGISNIRSINKRLFLKNERNGHIASWTYNGNSPYSLMIQKNREKQELIIEFTGKILLDKYPDLIGLDNIRLCLENINDLNICTLNIDEILCKSYITKCDVAIDVFYDQLGRLYRCLTDLASIIDCGNQPHVFCVEKPCAFDPRGQATVTPRGKI